MGKYQKNIEAARRISVMQYLQTYHPGELVRKTDKEYCTKTHSSLVITPANGLFHWFSQSKGGNNALDYLVKVEGMDFVSAVRLLNEMTPMPVSVQTVKAAPVQQQTSRPFVLPPADRNTEAATAYLMHRGVSPKVLRYCVGSGILYQTTRGNYRNCVFVGKDPDLAERSAFCKHCYKQIYTYLFVDDHTVGFIRHDMYLELWEGNYLTKTAQVNLTWDAVAAKIADLIPPKQSLKSIIRLQEKSKNHL